MIKMLTKKSRLLSQIHGPYSVLKQLIDNLRIIQTFAAKEY